MTDSIGIIALAIPLIISAFIAFFAFGMLFYFSSHSVECSKCHKDFPDERDLHDHMKIHKTEIAKEVTNLPKAA